MMENKYQHYVPRFYLRNFSNNGKSIGTYIFSQRKYVADAPIKKVCGRDYLYGEDLHIEKWFQGLEGKWAEIVGKILSTGKMNLDSEEWTYLLMFVYLSDVRTAYAADAFIDETILTTKVCAKLYREHRGLEITDEEIDQLCASVDKPNLYNIRNMEHLLDMAGDLSFVLLHNTSSRQFVTSDCPVVKYNQLFIARDYFRSYGYGHVGFQAFMPISPKFCLVLYDDVAYTCKNQKDFVIRINAPDQIVELNKLFVANARQAIYFNNSEREWVVERMVNKKADTSKRFENGIFGNEKQGFIIMHSMECVRKKVKLPQFTIRPEFLKVSFPNHAAGPLRPRNGEMDRLKRERKGMEFMKFDSAVKLEKFERAEGILTNTK